MAILANPSKKSLDLEKPKDVILEEKIVQWQEPLLNSGQNKQLPPWVIFGSATILILGLIGVGFWQKDNSYYLAAVVVIVASFSIYTQSHHSSRQLIISISNLNLEIGKHAYPLDKLAGFWLEEESGYILVNIEPKKAAILPLSFLLPSSNKNEVRNILLEVLPEVEARDKNISDSLNNYFKL